MSKELRRLPHSPPQAKGRTVYGYAAKFGVLSRNLGGSNPWYEIIEPGAFPPLNEQDCRAYWNHDTSRVLARSKHGTGTLRLSIDQIGLRYEFEAPNTTAGNDTLESIKRGDVDGASFAFTVGKDKWEVRDGKKVRRILSIKELHDVSPVTEGAYSSATAAARSLPPTDPLDEVKDWAARLGI